jgi:hypothetical protein
MRSAEEEQSKSIFFHGFLLTRAVYKKFREFNLGGACASLMPFEKIYLLLVTQKPSLLRHCIDECNADIA